MMAMREPPSFGVLRVGQHVQQEQELAVADPRQARAEPARGAALVLGAHGVLVALPVLAVGRIGDQVVEGLAGVAVVGERAAEGDVVGVAAGRVLHEQVGLRDRPGLGVHLLAEQMDLGVRVDRGPEQLAVLPQADRDVLLGDHQHAARAAAGVVDRATIALLARIARLVAGEHQIHHQVHDVARREVLAGILVQRFVELPDQLLEDRAHRRVVDPVGVQVDVLEALEHLEEKPRLVELADGVVEVELLQHLAHVGAEARRCSCAGWRRGAARRPGASRSRSGRCCRRRSRRPCAAAGRGSRASCPSARPASPSTFSLVPASTQSRRRRTVSGRMTSWYLPRLKVSRMRSATPQRKLTISLWFTEFGLRPGACRRL